MPCDYGAFRDANIAADRHSITFDPRPGSELEVGAKDHDIAGYSVINSEIGENGGSPGISRSCSGDQQRDEQEEIYPG